MKRKYLVVVVTVTRVEHWEVEASSPDEVALNCEVNGRLVSEDIHQEVSEVQEIRE